MKKDIFIDNNIASRFGNPMDAEYKKLVDWLIKNDKEQPSNNAYLVVSNKLIHEYNRSNLNPKSLTSIPIIIEILKRQERVHHIENEEIKAFQKVHFTKKVLRKLQSNEEDREHIPVVLLSDRKMALSIDDKFLTDLVNFAGFQVIAAKRPEELNYAD